MKTIKELFIKYYDMIAYLFFGVVTTVINYLVYIPCYSWLKDSAAVGEFAATISNGIAWTVAVIFAFLTNKPFVFKSHDWSAKTVVPELGKFLGCRIGSGVMETLILLLAVDVLHLNGNVMKLLTNVLVVIVNYIGSKLLVFTKKNT